MNDGRCGQILVMQFLHRFDLRRQFRHDRLRNRHGADLIALPAYGQHPAVKIKILHPQFQTFEEPQTAAVQQFEQQAVRMRKKFQDGFDFLPGEDDRNAVRLFRARCVLEVIHKPLTVISAEPAGYIPFIHKSVERRQNFIRDWSIEAILQRFVRFEYYIGKNWNITILIFKFFMIVMISIG